MHQADSPGPRRRCCIEMGSSVIKETPLTLVLPRGVPNWWHSFQAPWWRWKGHCDLTSRYSEAQSQGAGHLHHPRSPMRPTSLCLG